MDSRLEATIASKRTTVPEPKLSPSLPPNAKPNQVGTVVLYGIPIVSLVIENQERLCLAQISNTLLKQFSYNEIHNRRVALGITCVQCTPVQLEILRRAGAMPVSSRRCGMITRREAERLCKSFLGDNAPPRLPEDFAFSVHHECAWGCRGAFLPSRYNSSRAKCIKCTFCGLFFSPNKFIFHSHRTGPSDKYVQPDAANFNSWRRHMKLSGNPPEEITHAWEDVKAMFNGGTRKRLLATSSSSSSSPSRPPKQQKVPSPQPSFTVPPGPVMPSPRVPPFPELPLPISRTLVMDYMWHNQTKQFPFPPYATLPWLKRNSAPLLFPHDAPLLGFHQNFDKPTSMYHQSAFRPVVGQPLVTSRSVEETQDSVNNKMDLSDNDDDDDDDREVDIETTDDKTVIVGSISSGTNTPTQWSPKHETVNLDETRTSSPTVIELETSNTSKISSPVNLSPKSDLPINSNLIPGAIIVANRPASPGSVVDRLWSISRITQQQQQQHRMIPSEVPTAAASQSCVQLNHHPIISHSLTPVSINTIPISTPANIAVAQQHQLLYRQHQEALTRLQVIRDGVTQIHRNSESPSPIKALDCSACHQHNHVLSNYHSIDNNNKISP